MSIEQLRAQLDAILNKMEALNSLTVGDNGEVRSFSQEESDKYGKFETQAKEVREQIKRLESLREQREEVKRLNQPQQILDIPKIEVTREHNHNDKGEYRGYGEFKRGGFGEFLQDVATRAKDGIETIRLKELRAALGAQEGIGAEGGYLPQTDHAEMLFDTAKGEGKIASKCREIPVSGNSTTINMLNETSLAVGSQFGGVRAYWRNEASSVTATQPKFRQVNVALQALEALFYATEEQLEDAPQLEAFANEAFAKAMGFQLDDAIINGTGNGKPLGIINSPCLISVAKESGQSADTVNYNNVDKMVDRLLVGSELNASWVIHPNVRKELRNLIKTGTNTDFLVYLPANGLSGKPYDSLFGYPVERAQQCKDLGDLGDIILGDFSYYMLFRKSGIKAAQSMHVAFLTSQRCFKWTQRVNGQPMLNSAVTDANGSTTRSPFIALAERA